MVYFQNKTPNLGKFGRFEGFAMEDVGIFHGPLIYFTAIWYFKAIWYILWPFGIFYGPLIYFTAIWYF
jgi:hypothetical protein